MQMTEMIEAVQQRAAIDSNAGANDTLVAVAETLAERALDGVQENFAAQLPNELGVVVDVRDAKTQEAFDAAEFIRRVGQRLGISEEESQTRTHAALSIMLEGVTEGERKAVISAFPDDFLPYTVWDS